MPRVGCLGGGSEQNTHPYPATIYPRLHIYFGMHGGRCSFWSAEGLAEIIAKARKAAKTIEQLADGVEVIAEMIESTNDDVTPSDTPPVRPGYAESTPMGTNIVEENVPPSPILSLPPSTSGSLGELLSNLVSLGEPSATRRVPDRTIDGGLIRLKRREKDGK